MKAFKILLILFTLFVLGCAPIKTMDNTPTPTYSDRVVRLYDAFGDVFYMDYYTYSRLYRTYGYPGVLRYHDSYPNYYRGYNPNNGYITPHARPLYRSQPNYRPPVYRAPQPPNRSQDRPTTRPQTRPNDRPNVVQPRPSRGSEGGAMQPTRTVRPGRR